MDQIVIQAIGCVALFFAVLSFQNNQRGKIIFYLLISNIVFAIHFSLLHAWTGVIMNILGALRAILFYQKDTKVWAQHAIWKYVFTGAFILAGLVTWTNYSSLIPIIAGVIDTLGLWEKSAKSIRFFMLMPRPLWFSYDLLAGSFPGMATEVFVLISVLIGIFRFDIHKNLKSEQIEGVL